MFVPQGIDADVVYARNNLPDFLSVDFAKLHIPESSSTISLLAGYHHSTVFARQCEYDYCLARNLENPHIGSIVLFCEGDPPLLHDKLWIVPITERPTYQQYIEFANKNRQGKVVVLANSDIYFDATIAQVGSISGNKAYALSRWDVDVNGSARLFNRADSQDVWVWKPPLTLDAAEFWLGSPGCDNRFAALLAKAGLAVLNPSRIVKSYHVHLTNFRGGYGPRVRGPQKQVAPSNQL